ncbi:MAG: nitroreductase family protein [Alphaproteobacteria bacterium]|nr:nitroreductase family protein [Alphaproteobacteria bacterium]
MRRHIFYTLMAAVSLSGMNALAAEIRNLPTPDLEQKSPALMDLINTRKSERIYNKNKKIDDKTLSEILWVANGVNKYGRRTIATARNEQNLKVFVLEENGVWYYNAQDNRLEKVSNENAIPYTGEEQKFVFDAPVHLIYTSSDKHWGHAHAGSAYQNVYLYATAHGLATVIRGLINFDELHRALKLDKDEFVIAHQPVGYSE